MASYWVLLTSSFLLLLVAATTARDFPTVTEQQRIPTSTVVGTAADGVNEDKHLIAFGGVGGVAGMGGVVGLIPVDPMGTNPITGPPLGGAGGGTPTNCGLGGLGGPGAGGLPLVTGGGIGGMGGIGGIKPIP